MLFTRIFVMLIGGAFLVAFLSAKGMDGDGPRPQGGGIVSLFAERR